MPKHFYPVLVIKVSPEHSIFRYLNIAIQAFENIFCCFLLNVVILGVLWRFQKRNNLLVSFSLFLPFYPSIDMGFVKWHVLWVVFLFCQRINVSMSAGIHDLSSVQIWKFILPQILLYTHRHNPENTLIISDFRSFFQIFPSFRKRSEVLPRSDSELSKVSILISLLW